MLLLLLCATGSDVSHLTRSDAITGSDVTTGSEFAGSDVIFPRLFLTIVVVQNIPFLFIIRFTVSDYYLGIFWSLCCLSFDLRLLIIPLVSSNFPCKGTFCTTTLVKKSAAMTSLPVTWLTSLPLLVSLPVTWLTSLPVMASLPVTWLTSLPVAQSSSSRVNMMNPIIFWKPIIRFLFWEPLYCNVFYVI
jgi:hypothetical protein